MLIKKQDLRIGDEVIVPSNSNLKYFKILSIPKNNGNNFKVSCKIVDTTPRGQKITYKTFPDNIEEQIHSCYQNLDRDIWLVKREL